MSKSAGETEVASIRIAGGRSTGSFSNSFRGQEYNPSNSNPKKTLLRMLVYLAKQFRNNTLAAGINGLTEPGILPAGMEVNAKITEDRGGKVRAEIQIIGADGYAVNDTLETGVSRDSLQLVLSQIAADVGTAEYIQLAADITALSL